MLVNTFSKIYLSHKAGFLQNEYFIPKGISFIRRVIFLTINIVSLTGRQVLMGTSTLAGFINL
jgi:hypothetical protein